MDRIKKRKIVIISLITLILLQMTIIAKTYATDILEKEYLYISDLNYITDNNWSYVGWGEIKKDKNVENKKISLLVDGDKVFFNKGMGAHATSQLTYDVSKYSSKYTRFVAKLGIDSSKNGKGDVWFRISVSNDGVKWDEIYKSKSITSSQNALDVDLNIKDYKYLRLYADENKSNAVDHVVYADARIVKENYDISQELNDLIKPLSYYDDILAKNTIEDNYTNNLVLVFKRELVNRLGYWSIQNTLRDDNTKKLEETLRWLVDDIENLQLFIETGNVNNTEVFLDTLNKLYIKNKNLMGDKGDKLVYKKMLIALAVAYSSDLPATPLEFNSPMASYDVLGRYELMKKFYNKDLIEYKDQFKNYKMELLRLVMNDSVPNDELEWLRGYSETTYSNLDKRLNPYNYMRYVHPNYNQDKLYALENKDTFNKKYLLDQYGVSYGLNAEGKKIPRTWMVMEAGGICWNISRLGQNLYKVHGIPAVGVYQPAHEAHLTYSLNSENKGIWNIGNNIFGWGQSSTSWYDGNVIRLLFNWNNKVFTNKTVTNSTSGNSAGYQLLGQDAINDYDKYLESYYYYLIANSYSDFKIKEQIYNESLLKFNKNLDDFDKIIMIYKEQGNKTSLEWRVLAEKIIKAYTYYPMAMCDLLKLIEPNLSNEDVLKIDFLKTEALKKAANVTKEESLQPAAIKEIANALLGTDKVDLASFSFDGTNKNRIIINSKYDNYDFQVQYSLDGGNTWQATLEHNILLSNEQVKSINSTNDIKVKISGSSQIFTIDILPGESVVDSLLIMNDDEDIFIGKLKYLEYSLDNGITWNDYNSEMFTENQKVLVRYKAYETTLNGEIREYKFTENKDEILKYVYLKNISYVSSGSSQPGYSPQNMLDGSPFTSWHTKWGEIAKDKSYVVRFNKAKYLSQVAYDPAGLNGRIKSAKVYVSLDGNKWTLVKEVNNLDNNTKRKYIKLDETVPARFVKIEAIETYGNHEGPNKYVSGTRFNYYEDTTKVFMDPEIEYSINKITNQDVLATIKLPYGCIAVGETNYVFTKNGTFTFKYLNVNREEKELIANVDWIDKEVPTGKVKYDITSETQFAVKATLGNISKDNVEIIDGSNGTYTFTKNGEYTFKIKDMAGNVGQVIAKVTWIVEKEEKKEIINGDINDDGIYDIVDLLILNKHLVGKKIINDSRQLMVADVNRDGVVDIVDLSILNKMLKKD